MKNKRVVKSMIPLALAFLLGCGFQQLASKPIVAHAADPTSQVPRVEFDTCTTNGVSSGPCAQYLIQVNSGRGFGRFIAYRVLGGPVDPAGLRLIDAGNPTLLVMDNEPAPRGAVAFTIDIRE